MATIIYALSGQGRGHTSRAIAVSELLRSAGHRVMFCCGGTAQDVLEGKGESVIPVPALRQVMQNNKIQLAQTVRENWRTVLGARSIIRNLADELAAYHPDLLITDFEAFAPRAARHLDLPVLSFNHQQVVTETRYSLPPRYWLPAFVTRSAISLIAPRHPEHVLLTSFFFSPLKHPERTTLVPPIIRPAVQELSPRQGNHVLVYYNQTHGAHHVLRALSQVDASFVAYNFDAPAEADRYENIQFKEPSLEGFLEDLATSRAVLCTAGFTLISEALYLSKPLLVVPNRGIFEQTLNAMALQREGLGEAVLEAPLSAADVTSFLGRLKTYEARLAHRTACGNEEAVACIERVLNRIGAAPPEPTTVRAPYPASPAPASPGEVP